MVRQVYALRYFFRHSPAAVLGWLLLFAWCIWWADNLFNGRMAYAEYTWIHLPAFGVDYLFGVDGPVRTWMAGGNPYANKQQIFAYPPIITWLFAWVPLTTPEIGLRIWIVMAALCATVGALAATTARRELTRTTIPDGLAIASILFSTPVLFALERANYDLLIVPSIVGAILLMRRNTITADVIAGLLLAVAIWAKLYPGLLVFGLFALRRWRVVIWVAVGGAVITLSDLTEVLRFLENNKIHIEQAHALARGPNPEIHPWNHPLGLLWHVVWAGTPLVLLPGYLGTALLLGSLLAWVSWRLYECPERDRLALPFLFWVVALATFVPPVSNDYNLTPLLLAVLAIWSRDDRWSVHLAFAALVLWWQPFALPLSGRVVMFIKLAGLIAVAVSLASRVAGLSFQKR